MGTSQITVIILPTSSAETITFQTLSQGYVKAIQPSVPYVEAITLPITKNIQHTIKSSSSAVKPINQISSSPIKKNSQYPNSPVNHIKLFYAFVDSDSINIILANGT